MSQQLRFERYDAMERMRAVKELAQSILYFDNNGHRQLVKEYAEGIVKTLEGVDGGWG